jgi:signal transduction histidine kinase/ligand-binding sensor domain-containing protein
MPLHAALRDDALSRFQHTAWTIADGAPADIWALAQAPDGFLWLGTGSGLFKFDGLRFERHEPPAGGQLLSSNVTALTIVSPDEIWIGYYTGGASRLRRAGIVHYPPGDGLPAGTVYRIARGGDGTLWMATDHGLAEFRDGRWHTVGAARGYPWPNAYWVLVDSSDTLWVASGETVVRLRPGATAFERTGVETAPQSTLAEAADGTIWIADVRHGTRPIGDGYAAATAPAPGLATLHAKRLLFHSDGSLWGTDTARGGAFRLATPTGAQGVIEAFAKRQGLTSDMAVPAIEDIEGNVWIGTNFGLNRFRRNSVVAVAEVADVAHQGFGLAGGRGDAVSLAGGGTLFSADGSSTRARIGDLPRIVAAHESGDGILWLIGSRQLLRVQDDQLREVPLPGGRAAHEILAMTSDATGAPWISLSGEGIHRHDDGRWVSMPRLPDDLPNVLAADANGGMWSGYPRSRAAFLHDGRLREFGAAEGLAVGNVTAISATARHVLVAGEQGIARLSGERFTSLGGHHATAFLGITGIAETADGDLWLNGSQGVVRIEGSELERALRDRDSGARHVLLDAQNGLPGVAVQSSPVSTIVEAGDGRLWFNTNQGAAWIDPARIQRNPRPPTVIIRTLTAGGTVHGSESPIRLPTGTTSLEIDYTATSLTLPERTNFLYRLEDVDGEWQDAGIRRQAFYTNLGPGDYRFHVIAANSDGVWNHEGARLDFSIPPTFVQTRWFLLLCIVGVMGVLWLLYLMRLRRLGLHIRSRLHERHMERERIARELHDTLLQSIQGLILRFQAVAETIPPSEPARAVMERALERADQVLEEGRDRVLDLRASTQYTGDLCEVFAAVAAELSQDHPAVFKATRTGIEQPIDPLVRDDIFRIGREALLNAYRHADAKNIDVAIDYSRDDLQLRFVDDGRGMDARILEKGGRPGHWGLSGMRERAERVGGRLSIWSRAGSGTEIELRIPADAAYRPCLNDSRWRWLRALLRRPDRLPDAGSETAASRDRGGVA